MEVVTAEFKDAAAPVAASDRARMMAGPGKMCAFIMLAQRMICNGPDVNCFWTVPVERWC